MSSLFSPSWYRVAALKPRLRSHVQVHRQPYKQELSYLLQDLSCNKVYRFNPSAYEIIGRMDGEHTVHEIWEAVMGRLGDEAPSQDETIELLGRLHSVDVLQMSVTPDCLELFRRARQRRGGWLRALRTPLSLRVPLFDPDRLLDRLVPVVGPLICRKSFAVWLVVVSWAAVVAAGRWPELVADATKHALEPLNLTLLAVIYPFVKALHELGHALTTKKWGGEVHEVGITLLVFMPVPYVDASAASVIPGKSKRMAVGAAGMGVELLLAAIALGVWLHVEPGLVRLAALNVMLICGVSTVVFNGNPLMRYDAYHILKDAIGVPNLGPRSSRQLGYLVQRHLFGLTDAQPPATSTRERNWLLLYGLTSTPYRLLVTFKIILFVAGKFFFIGVMLALWAAVSQIALPLLRQASFVLLDRRLQQRRARAVAIAGALVGTTLAGLFLVPLPVATVTQGVVWLPEQARVRSGIDGRVERLLATPGAVVHRGQPLVELRALEASGKVRVLEAELEELQARLRIEEIRDPVKAKVLKEALPAKEAELALAREQVAELVVESPSDGVFVVVDPEDWPGRFVRQGEEIAMVVDPSEISVRAVVGQDDIGLVREHLSGVELKLAEAIGTTIPARVVRSVPAAHDELPSRALGSAGGGPIAVDPADRRGLTPLRTVFQYDVAFAGRAPNWRIGERVYVKFEHGEEPLAHQWYRRGRQLFLARFGV